MTAMETAVRDTGSSGTTVDQSEEMLTESHDGASVATTSGSMPINSDPLRKLRIAVTGCSHGEMDKIYACAAEIEKVEGLKFDLLICTGDYQAVRNSGDLLHMHAPAKYRKLQTFHRYYSGEIVAPILTLVIGGNHEASGYMQELPYGGWIAPRIYYLGHASVVSFGGLRIAGLSGIYNGLHYDIGHFERPPFAQFGSVVSVYHVRSIDVFRLKQLEAKDKLSRSGGIDIMVTHDWPSGITEYGDVNELLKIKPHFTDDIKKCSLGNPATTNLLHQLRPRYWLSSHLHCTFPALVPHEEDDDKNTKFTHFLALDKPIPGRQFLQALDIDVECESHDLVLKYDPTWLTVLRLTDKLTNATDKKSYMPSAYPPSNDRWDFRPTEEEISETLRIFGSDLTIPENFARTAPPQEVFLKEAREFELYYRNPQTAAFCERLGIKDLNGILCTQGPEGVGTAYCTLESVSSTQTTTERQSIPECSVVDEMQTGVPENGEDCFFIDKTPEDLTSSDKRPAVSDKDHAFGNDHSNNETAALNNIKDEAANN